MAITYKSSKDEEADLATWTHELNDVGPGPIPPGPTPPEPTPPEPEYVNGQTGDSVTIVSVLLLMMIGTAGFIYATYCRNSKNKYIPKHVR